MIQMPFGPSRAICIVVNGGRSCVFRPNSAVRLSPRSAKSEASTTRFRSFHCRAATRFHSRRKYACGISNSKTLSTCSSPLFSSTAPLTIRPTPTPSMLLVACLTPSDVTQLSDEWFALRKDKLTASTFSTALGFWKGKRRAELWREKAFVSDTELADSSKRAMEWGMLNEAAAIERYKGITGREVSSYGFAVHSEERFNWVGASPDGLLGCVPGGGILEVKCPYNKGKPEKGSPWNTVPFYYMPQMQGQMEIMDREWVDLYCWTPNGSTIFRIYRDRSYWNLINGILGEFWWENVIPAREALLLGKEEDANAYEPSSTHKLTGLAIAKSLKLSGESKLLCREVAGHLEFFR